MTITITQQFQNAFDLIENGNNVLISGKAGTGKSTLLKMFLERQHGKNVLITAPTGVAALNVEGYTIHRAFGFRPGMFPDDIKPGGEWYATTKTAGVLKKTDILVVDEISMVRADLFDMMDLALKRVRGNLQPFGGVQLVLVGDLLQLPPVITPNEADFFSLRWETPFFFSAHIYPELQLEEVQLSEVWRQKDSEFIDVLNEVREGTATDDVLEILNRNVDPNFDPPADWVTLTSRKKTVQRINETKLAQLSSKKYRSLAISSGQGDVSTFSGVDELNYAVGARVMTVINDPMNRFVNGSFGEIVRATADEIDVRIDATQEVVTLRPHKWEIKSPTIDGGQVKSETVGSITQFPIILAWAITIHKSQGKTIPKCFINLTGGTATEGQFYVALSRAVDLKHLKFNVAVEPRHIRANNALVRKVKREVSTAIRTNRVVLISFDGVNFGVSEHVARIHAIIYQDGGRVADFGSWINPMADLGEFGRKNSVPVGGLALAPTLADFWPLLLRQAEGGIVVGDRLMMLERAVRHQEKGLDVGLGIGYEAGDFDCVIEGSDVQQRCNNLAAAFEKGLITPSRGQVVPKADKDAEGAVYIPTWANHSAMVLDQSRATDSDNAWAAMSGAAVIPQSISEVEECTELLSAWGVSRGFWNEELKNDVRNRAQRIFDIDYELPETLSVNDNLDVLLAPGTRVAFTGRNWLLGGPADDERLAAICEAKELVYKKGMSKSRCDVLVAGDLASMSNKAQRAREYGKPMILQSDFEEWYEKPRKENVLSFDDSPETNNSIETGASPIKSSNDAGLFDERKATSKSVPSEALNVVLPEAFLSEGTRVAFRGSTIIDNELYPHGTSLQMLCDRLGIVYKQAVTKTRCDVLVTDDIDAEDGKTGLARRYSKPVIRSEAFANWASKQLAEELEEGDTDANANHVSANQSPINLLHNEETIDNDEDFSSPPKKLTEEEKIEVKQPSSRGPNPDGNQILKEAEELRRRRLGFTSVDPFENQDDPYNTPAPLPTALPTDQAGSSTKVEKLAAAKRHLIYSAASFAILFVLIVVAALMEANEGVAAFLVLAWFLAGLLALVFGTQTLIRRLKLNR